MHWSTRNKNQVSAREDGMSLLLKSKLFSFMDDKESIVTSEEIDEIEVYLQDKNYEKNENLLLFWKANSLKCRVLSKLVKKLLGIPATSAPIERVFSHTGKKMHIYCLITLNN